MDTHPPSSSIAPVDGPGLTWQLEAAPSPPPARAYLPLLRMAVAAHPDRHDLRRDLAIALRDDECWSEIIDLLAPLERTGRLSPDLAWELGMAAAACEDWPRARAALEIAIGGQVPRSYSQLATVLEKLGDTPGALTAACLALDENARNHQMLTLATRFLRDQPDRLLELLDALSGRAGNGPTFLACRAVALAATGQQAELQALVDPACWCARFSLQGLVDDERLVQAIMGHPALAVSAIERPTRGRNMRLTDMSRQPDPAIRALLALIRDRVDAYVAERRHLDHPVMAARPDKALLQGWALALMDDGHETTHIHPAGWLSVVYYVRTPVGPEPGAGDIVFGTWPDEWTDRLPTYPTQRLSPRAGDLLIFPSFMGHRTIPTGVDEPRLCMAFDVIPHRDLNG